MTHIQRLCYAGLCLLAAGHFVANSQESSPSTGSAAAIHGLEAWLRIPRGERPVLTNSTFALTPLTHTDAERAARLLWNDHVDFVHATRAAEMKAGVLELDSLRMRFEMVFFGDTNSSPPAGHSLFISLHGGGNAPASVNDSQWHNQVRLGRSYAPAEGVYLAPRAPTDTWNLWHQEHIDRFFDRLIENLIVLHQVNPDRVYLLGYSAGGDGVYQLGPRMADRWAAAAMMGGHPNEASPLGLRNVPFAIQVGELDSAYKRNEVAAEWGRKLDELERGDPSGYTHFTELHAGKGHWMQLEDRKAIPWMEKFSRNPLPTRVVWHQDDVTHDRFYWLALPPGTARQGQEVKADHNGATVTFESTGLTDLMVRFNDAMTDLDQPITLRGNGKTIFTGRLHRTITMLEQTLRERGDPRLVFSAEVAVRIP